MTTYKVIGKKIFDEEELPKNFENDIVEKKIKKEAEQINIENVIEDIEVSVEEEALKEYTKKAAEVGYSPASLIKERVLHFLKKKSLKAYNYDKVSEFLDEVFEGDWEWFPLNEKSRQSALLLDDTIEDTEFEVNRTYQKEIPIRTLQLVCELQSEIPELSFFVSDKAILKPDPFLAVSCVGMEEIIVIDHWKEPTFKN